jgi:hypothetical protein
VFQAGAAYAGSIVAQRRKAGEKLDTKKLTDALVWKLDWGETFDTIVAAAQAAGVPLRMLPCVATRADPHQHLLLEWEALSAHRQGRGAGEGTGRSADQCAKVGARRDRLWRGLLASRACTTLALWHKYCLLGKVGFSLHVISKS